MKLMWQASVVGVIVIGLLAVGRADDNRDPQLPATPQPDLNHLLAEARMFSGGNTDWVPVVQVFDGMEMVLVPAGCFVMGSQDDHCISGIPPCERPAHRVCFASPFWIDRTEVTNWQYARFEGRASDTSRWIGRNRPRDSVSWNEARDFCARRGGRLPTEAEWEYAARGPESWAYPWGETFDSTRVVWNRGRDEGSVSVGSLPAGASWVGALDLSGNVWEWVADWYEDDHGGDGVELVDPTGPETGRLRIVRGGSWWNSVDVIFRGSYYVTNQPEYRDDKVGFRCVRPVG